jgi:hypothetical protein
VEAILEKAEKQAAASIGKDFTIQGIAGKIAGVDNGRIRIRSGGAEFSQPLWNLKTSEILELAKLREDGIGEPLGVAMLYLSRGETEKAKKILDGREARGAATAIHRSLLEEMETRLAEKKAEGLIASVQKLVLAKKWSRASEIFETLRDEYSDTQAYAASRKTIDSLGSVIEREALRAEEKKAGGGAAVPSTSPMPGIEGAVRRVAGVNAFRVDYTFDRKEELNDWEPIGSSSSSSKRWQVENGHLSGRSYSGLRNKIRFVGDVSLEAKITGASNFAVHIGEYRFTWYRYSYFYGSTGVDLSVSKQGMVMPGGENYLYNIPLEMLPMRWLRKKDTLTWYWGTKKILKVKDKGDMNEDSTIRIESRSSYSSSHASDRNRYSVKMDDIRVYGMVDAEWLKEIRDKAANK